MTTELKQNAVSYKDSGVDIDAGNALVKAIAPLAAATTRAGCNSELGGFGGLFDIGALNYKHPVLVAATDGVGTKLAIAITTNQYDTLGIDLVAMCVNDLIVQGAEPLFFLDYYATGTLDNTIATDVIKGVADGCKQAGCALIGGETAEMPGLYAKGDFDIAGFCVGAAEKDQILPRTDDIAEGDVIIGLPSSGIHSNGYSLVRHILKSQNIAYDTVTPFDSTKTFGNVLMEPTVIYVKSCLEAIRTDHVKALAHITGGGLLENIPRVLPDNYAAQLDSTTWEQPAIFGWLQEQGNIAQSEMYRTFNCGIGMVLILKKDHADTVMDALSQHDQPATIIGHITEKTSPDAPSVVID